MQADDTARAPSSAIPVPAGTGRYRFTAGGADAVGVMFVSGLLVLVTCGVAMILGVPAARLQYWGITSTARDGQRFRYEATFGESVGAALVRTLLFFVTCGLALPWTSAMSQRFRIEHTSTAEGHRMRFTGTGGEVLGLWLLMVVALPLSFGLAWPWLAVLRERWVASNTVVIDPSAPGGEYSLRFDAGPLSYVVQGGLSLLLTIVTFGLYSPWALAGYHDFVWSSMSDTLSPPVAVPSGPRTPAQWAVVAATGFGLALLVGSCLFFGVLPKVTGSQTVDDSASAYDDDAVYDENGGFQGEDSTTTPAAGEVARGAPGGAPAGAMTMEQMNREADRQADLTGWSLGPAAALPTLAVQWRSLDAGAARDAVRFLPTGGAYVPTLPGSMDSASVGTLARAFGGAAARGPEPAADAPAPFLLWTTGSLHVRAAPSPSGADVSALQARVVLVGVRGVVDGMPSAIGARTDWSYVVVDSHRAGWSSAAYLETYSQCVPSVDPFVATLPEMRRSELAADVMLRALPTLLVGTRRRLGFLLSVYDASQQRSYLGVYSSTARCSLESVARYEQDHPVSNAFLVDASPSVGPALVVLRGPVTDGRLDGAEIWQAFLLESGQQLWRATLPSAETVPWGDRARVSFALTSREHTLGYWPIRVRQGEVDQFYRWDGATLVPEP